MSKITLSAILTILRVVFTLGEKVVRSLYTIIDICDDGIVNSSVAKPDWYNKLVSVISNIEDALYSISSISDGLDNSSNSNG